MRRLRNLKLRARLETEVRRFFIDRGYLEPRTPILVPSPGMEPHIRPFEVIEYGKSKSAHEKLFLHTSPEFAMKRLLAKGAQGAPGAPCYDKLFQICQVFRAEPRSRTHSPEFTMLEWYRAHADDESLRQETEALFYHLALQLHNQDSIVFDGKRISVKPPWPRLKVRDLFLEHTGIDLGAQSTRNALAGEATKLGLSIAPQDSWDDIYFRLWFEWIEKKLPQDQAVFVTRYPASQAALSIIDHDPDGTAWAKRFEIYAGGLELGNAFEELTDPIEQRRRFETDMEFRERTYGTHFPRTPIDERFLAALKDVPPCSGIAIGIDRLVMLFADETDIQYTFWLSD